MSAVGEGADVYCQWLSGPFIAKSRQSRGSKFIQLKGENRPEFAVHSGWRECQVSDRKADIAWDEAIVRRRIWFASLFSQA
jgi:hypothetical protein